jgi:hypothetical protein
MHIIADSKCGIYSEKFEYFEEKNMLVDSIDKVAGIRNILSSPHVFLDDTFRALLATNYPVSQHRADIHRGLNPICYTCKLGDCNCYLVYRWRSRGDS